MEHRCGSRRAVNQAVYVRTGGGLSARGNIFNISISGAFLVTPLPLRPLCYVQVQFLAPAADRQSVTVLEGQVVREDPRGFGIEWCEFAPSTIHALVVTASPSLEFQPTITARQAG